MPLIEVRGLTVDFGTPDGTVHAVRGIDFELEAGRTLGIVGESGSGKSQTVLSLMGLLADNGRSSGSARFEGRELIGMPDRGLRGIRGNRIAMIFQDPMTSLNPYLKIGVQMAQVLELHEGMRPAAGAAALRRAARSGADTGRRQAPAVLAARAVRRHAPARNDSDRPVVHAGASDRGRAHDRAGRYRAGADPQPDAGTAARLRCRHRFHHARPRHRCRLLRRRAG